jgi:hypothetical protein
MLDDNTVSRTFVWAGVAVLVAMVGSCTTLSLDRLAKWEAAVKNGADPMLAGCALFEQSEAEKVTCALLATKK